MISQTQRFEMLILQSKGGIFRYDSPTQTSISNALVKRRHKAHFVCELLVCVIPRLTRCLCTEYRLPCEAEWEYACRAGTTTRYYFGDDITDKLAKYKNNMGKTTTVGKYPPNTFGLYDMHGNVWEWCQDDWHENYIDAPNDGSAGVTDEISRKIIRGGSFGDDPITCRSVFRGNLARDYRNCNIGFRVVCIAPQDLALLL